MYPTPPTDLKSFDLPSDSEPRFTVKPDPIIEQPHRNSNCIVLYINKRHFTYYTLLPSRISRLFFCTKLPYIQFCNPVTLTFGLSIGSDELSIIITVPSLKSLWSDGLTDSRQRRLLTVHRRHRYLGRSVRVIFI